MPIEAGDDLIDRVEHRPDDRIVIPHLPVDLEALDPLQLGEEFLIDVAA